MTFTPEIYEQIREGAKRSAAALVPYVVEIVKPKTVVDVGCGEGWFAREFARKGCQVVALDSEVATETVIGPSWEVKFRNADLAAGDAWASPEIEADLAVCLEVAEHLPEAAADAFIATLCALAPVILFSAAIPGQGGHGHLNEAWPAYWAEKFYRLGGLVATDELRVEFWDDETVEPWYRQNCLIFARHEWMREKGFEFTKYPRSVVHPVIWEHRRQRP